MIFPKLIRGRIQISSREREKKKWLNSIFLQSSEKFQMKKFSLSHFPLTPVISKVVKSNWKTLESPLKKKMVMLCHSLLISERTVFECIQIDYAPEKSSFLLFSFTLLPLFSPLKTGFLRNPKLKFIKFIKKCKTLSLGSGNVKSLSRLSYFILAEKEEPKTIYLNKLEISLSDSSLFSPAKNLESSLF